MVEALYLIRHGQTQWSKAGKHTGLTDIPLTKEGQKEARALGQSLKNISFSHVFCSPLLRVVQTASIAGLSANMTIDPDLVEINYGDFEGITSKEIKEIDPMWGAFIKDCPNGETLDQIKTRADRVIARVLELEGNVVVASSGHFSRVLGTRWIQQQVSFAKHLFLSTASKSVLSFEHSNRVIQSWNDTSFL